MNFIRALEKPEERRAELFCNFLLFCIAVGIILHIIPYFYNRALWIDEAMLASSICTRTLKNLVLTPLDFGQSAAIGWLYIEKILTCIFGESEIVLRILQLFSSFGCMILLYLIMNGRIRKYYILFTIAVFSLTNRYIYYGNELKPYMFDNFCCLLIMFLWIKLKTNKIRIWQFVSICTLMIWFSFPVVFYIASCIITLCISELTDFTKTKKNLRIPIYFIVLLSFIIYYKFWLAKTSDNAGAPGYWNLLKLPIIPRSLSDLALIYKMFKNSFSFYQNFIFVGVICVLFCLWCIKCIIAKKNLNDITLPFCISIFLLLFANSIGFYPIIERLVQSWVIFILVFAIFELDAIEKKFNDNSLFLLNENNVLYLLILMVFLAFVGMNGCRMLFKREVFNSKSEIKPIVHYLQENMKDSDSVYVFVESVPAFMYYYQYKDIPIAHQHTDRYEKSEKYLYGNNYHRYLYQKPYNDDYEILPDKLQEEVYRILEHESVYIFNSHKGVEQITYLLDELKKYGIIEVKYSFMEIKLYHFQKFNND